MGLDWTQFSWTIKRYFSIYGVSFEGALDVTQPALGDPVSTLASSATGDDPKEITYQNKVLTTSATPTLIDAVAVPATTTMGFHGYVTARRTGGSSGTAEDGAYYQVEFTAKNSGGTAVLLGNTVNAIGESQAGWDVTLSAAAATIQILVTGAANNNISWVLTGMTNPISS